MPVAGDVKPVPTKRVNGELAYEHPQTVQISGVGIDGGPTYTREDVIAMNEALKAKRDAERVAEGLEPLSASDIAANGVLAAGRALKAQHLRRK